MRSAAIERSEKFSKWRANLRLNQIHEEVLEEVLGKDYVHPQMPYFPPPNIVAALKAERRSAFFRKLFRLS